MYAGIRIAEKNISRLIGFLAMQEIRKILRAFGLMKSGLLYKIIKISDLTQEECKIIQEFYIKNNKRENICMKMNKTKTPYNNLKNLAEIKIKIALNNLLDEKLAQMAK